MVILRRKDFGVPEPSTVPTDWFKEFLSLLPDGCRLTVDCEKWVKDQYLLGRNPYSVFGELNIIDF